MYTLNSGFYTYDSREADEIDKFSKTVPDQALTVREIISRFTRGTMELPDYEVGEDDTFDTDIHEYDDLVDAQNDLDNSNAYLRELSVAAEEKEESKHHDVVDDSPKE